MVKVPIKVKETIKKYITALNKNNVPIKKAILFGSYAKGYNHKWSDIDLALVSDIFVGDRMIDRNKIRRITLSISSDIEVLPYSTKDFTAEDPFVKEILETGIELT